MRTGHVYANHFPGRSLTDQSSVCASYLLGLDVHYRGQSLPPKGYVRPIKGEYPLLAPKRTFEFRRSMSPVRCKRSFNLTANPKVTRLRHACQGGRVNGAVITHAGRKKTPPCGGVFILLLGGTFAEEPGPQLTLPARAVRRGAPEVSARCAQRPRQCRLVCCHNPRRSAVGS